MDKLQEKGKAQEAAYIKQVEKEQLKALANQTKKN